MFVKHEFTAEQFQYLRDLAESNDTNIKAYIKKAFRQYLSEQMEGSNVQRESTED